MSTWITANVVITLIGYLMSTIAFMVYLLRFSDRLMKIGRGLLLFACLLHGVALAHLVMVPVGFGTAELVTFVASFAVVLLYFLVGLRYSVESAGPFIAPIVTVVLYSVWVGSQQTPQPVTPVEGPILVVHIGASFLGILSFLVAFVVSVLYIQQDFALRKKRLSSALGRRFPPQVTLNNISGKAIKIGFPLYTIGIVLGAFWFAKDGLGEIAPQYVLAIVSWGVYAVLLHGRLTIGWSGRRAAVTTIVGFLGALSVLLIYLSRSIT